MSPYNIMFAFVSSILIFSACLHNYIYVYHSDDSPMIIINHIPFGECCHDNIQIEEIYDDLHTN